MKWISWLLSYQQFIFRIKIEWVTDWFVPKYNLFTSTGHILQLLYSPYVAGFLELSWQCDVRLRMQRIVCSCRFGPANNGKVHSRRLERFNYSLSPYKLSFVFVFSGYVVIDTHYSFLCYQSYANCFDAYYELFFHAFFGQITACDGDKQKVATFLCVESNRIVIFHPIRSGSLWKMHALEWICAFTGDITDE